MALDTTAILGKILRDCGDMWAKDLAAHRPEEFTKPPARGRSVADIAYETLLINRRIAARLRGDVPEPMSGFPACPPDLQDHNAMAAAIVESVEGLIAAAGDDTERIITLPDGDQEPAFSLAEFASSHMYYHLGQVNYAQVQYGDSEVHWK